MAVSVTGQMLTFLISCLVGAALGLLYDLFRIFRIIVPCSRLAVLLLDVLFFIMCTVVTFLFALLSNSGTVRFFILEGEVIGAVLYALTLGIPLMRLTRKLADRAKRKLRVCGERLRPHVEQFGGRVGSGLKNQASKIKNLLRNQGNLLQIRLQVLRKVLYNLIHTKSARDKRRAK